ncbi:MAG: heme o synthase [Firmicutes bacterium]|nr:heme o synthase [Bacillota bacterium]
METYTQEIAESPVGDAGPLPVLGIAAPVPSAGLGRRWEVVRAYVELTKPRIMLLLLFTAFSAMVVASGGHLPLARTLWTMLGLALSTGGAAALNMWYDRDIDAIMRRTQRRPLPQGLVAPGQALAFGIILGVVSTLLLAVAVNPLTAGLSLGGFLYYVFIYTMWLKRTTPQNIVIGGGAGAFPPLVGWAAVTGHLAAAAGLMFLIVFLWTPPHFWALALFKNDDYRRAGIPMMPAVRGERVTKRQSVGYAVLLVAASLLLYGTGVVGRVYLGVAAVAGLGFLILTVAMAREQLPAVKWAKRTFLASLMYLAAVFIAMVLNVHA